MPPARPRPLEDSRSETSSNIGYVKEKNRNGLAMSSGVAKTKRTVVVPHTSSLKPTVNGAAVTQGRSGETDPNLPKTDWNDISPSILRAYRTAYHLPTPTTYTCPHAELIYNSCRTALRSPSAVLARRRLRDLKQQRRTAILNGHSTAAPNIRLKQKGKEKDLNIDAGGTSSSDHLLKPPDPTHHPFLQTPDATSDASQSASQTALSSTHTISPEHIGRQTPLTLATAVRKHFNAQQLSEAETVARFAYVVRQTRSKEATKMEGSDGDGRGYWMGSHGREVRRGEGGEAGFRLRFRP